MGAKLMCPLGRQAYIQGYCRKLADFYGKVVRVKVNDMALKEEKVSQEKAERNKATLEKLHETPGFMDKIREGYAQIERGESVTVTMDDIKSKLKIVD